MDIKVYFQENLRKLRKARKLSQADLGRIVNKSYNAIYKWENGLTEPTLKDIYTLSYDFGIPVEVLLYQEIDLTTFTIK